MPDEVLLRVDSIDVYYGSLQVLWDISIEVKSGEIVAIAGANGAGKTTLMRTISGVLHPAQGSIEFDGQDITQVAFGYEPFYRGIYTKREGRRHYLSDQVWFGLSCR